MSRAQRFLERFRAADDAHNPLDMLHEDSEGFGAVLAEAPEALLDLTKSRISGRAEGSATRSCAPDSKAP